MAVMMFLMLPSFFAWSVDVPEAPAPPEIVSIRHESATLNWNDPKDSGGSPITGNMR
jgi:hypothetical protein